MNYALLGSAVIHAAGSIAFSWLLLIGNHVVRWLTIFGAVISPVIVILRFSEYTSGAGFFSFIGLWYIAAIIINLGVGSYLLFSPKVREYFA